MTRILILFLLCLIAVACQPAPSDEPWVVSDWAPTAQPERAPPQTVELAGGQQETSKRPDIPVADQPTGPETGPISTLAPTPVPSNLFFSEANGFSLPFPSSWELLESGADWVQLYDPTLGLYFLASTDFKDAESSYETFLEEIVSDDNEFLSDMTVLEEGEIRFTESGTAKTALLSGYDSYGDEIGVWIAYYDAPPRMYTFAVSGNPDDVVARETSLKTMAAQVKPAGTYVFGLDRDQTLVLLGGDPDPKDLDPARQLGSAEGYVGLLYRGLVRLSPEGQVLPDLAESWSVSDGGLTYTFTLRDGLKFHSGKAITAGDVQASWERATDPETDSTTVATYMGDILGVPEKLSGEAENIAGLEVIDDRTLAVTLDGPKPYFLLKLSYPTSFILDLDTVDPDDEAWVFEPNASGPYTLAEFKEDTGLIFKRNEQFHTPAKITNVVYLLYRVGSGISLFDSGEVDIVYLGSADKIQVREPENEHHEQWQSRPGLSTAYLQFNNNLAPMDDPNVRLALSLAVDRDSLNELMSEGTDMVANTILPPAMPGFSAELSAGLTQDSFNPEAAREALANSTYADSLPAITLNVGGFGTTERDDINAIVANWEDYLGVTVEVIYIDPEDYARTSRENPAHIAYFAWRADYPDPENFLDVLFHTGSEFNLAGYSNPEVDSILDEARIELDPQRRLQLYQEAEAALMADVACVTLDHTMMDVLVNPRVKGYVLTPIASPITHLLELEPAEGG